MPRQRNCRASRASLIERLEDRRLLSAAVGGLEINGRVFDDADANGMRDSGDQPVVGAIVFADLNHDAVPQANEPQAKVDLTGTYMLRLPPGSYTIRCTLRPGDRFSTPAAVDVEGTSTLVKVVQIDFGQYGTGRVGGFLFVDFDGNGIRDGDDRGRSGIVYVDLNQNGVPDDGEPYAVTPSTGQFQFNLYPGTYQVRQALPPGLVQTTPADKGPWIVNARSGLATLPRGLGAQPVNPAGSASISGSIFNDANHNAIRDATEGPLANVPVNLWDSTGNLVGTTFSSPTGDYQFDGLAAGTYAVRQLRPTDYRRTTLPGEAMVDAGGGSLAMGPTFGDVATASVPLDFNYLLALAQHFNGAGAFAAGDLDGDDRVTFADLLLLAQNYGSPLRGSILRRRSPVATTRVYSAD